MGLENTFSGDTPVSDVADAVERDGYAVVRGAIDPQTVAAMAADLDPWLNAAHTGHESVMGSLTKRFGALLARSDTVQRLLMDPTVLAVADRVLLPYCARYRVHYTGVMHLESGEKQQVLHRDTGLFPIANPAPPLTLATMWAITDFTRDNGATRVVPGSHPGISAASTSLRLILDGHTRWQLALQEGRFSVACIEYDLTGEQVLLLMLDQYRPADRLNAFCRIVMALWPWNRIGVLRHGNASGRGALRSFRQH